MRSQPAKRIKLAIGLGNPGQQYQNTYHNAGSLFIDYITKKRSLPDSGLSDIKWLKSKVYMNNSGDSVLKMLKKFNVRPAEILIIHDDADIALGQYRLVFGRGPAGHRGVESIIKKLKTKNFWRLRIGIRKSAENYRNSERIKAGGLVLREITSADKKIFESVFQKILNFEFRD